MKKYQFISYFIFANNEDEALENIQESLQQNEITDCFSCIETELTFKDIVELNLLGLNQEALNNLTEKNFKDYLLDYDNI